jgi:hypothetical protein
MTILEAIHSVAKEMKLSERRTSLLVRYIRRVTPSSAPLDKPLSIRPGVSRQEVDRRVMEHVRQLSGHFADMPEGVTEAIVDAEADAVVAHANAIKAQLEHSARIRKN